MDTRYQLLQQIASEIQASVRKPVTFVGIDGIDGAGKTCFADELAACFPGFEVIRASVDGFHNPRAVRYARGKDSPEGYFLDSFDYDQLKRELLDPLRSSGPLRYRTAVFDHRCDAPVASTLRVANPPSILLFDGIFLHRPELAGYWDYSIFLQVDRREALRRCNARESAVTGSDDPADPRNARYVNGQAIYLSQCRPWMQATRVIDNDNLERPRLLITRGRDDREEEKTSASG